jgi:hypothetical protein
MERFGHQMIHVKWKCLRRRGRRRRKMVKKSVPKYMDFRT